MIRNLNWRILAALAIFLLSGSSHLAGANVSPEVIQETALNFLRIRSNAPVGQIKLWQDASLSDMVPYHDFFGNEIAYCFSVVNDKEEILGYKKKGDGSIFLDIWAKWGRFYFSSAVLTHSLVPTNGGGISLGQAVVANFT